jgi:hypothetical protein
MSPRPIAVVLDGPPTPAWQARALSLLEASPLLRVVEARLLGAVRRGRTRRLHAAIERRLLYLGPDALAGVAVERAPSGTGAAADPATLVVWLAERPPSQEESRELLHLRHGRRSEPAEDAFRRAVLDGADCVETDVLLERPSGTVVIERTISEVRPFSATLSRDHALWKLAAIVARAAERTPGLELPAPPAESLRASPSTAALLARSALSWPRMLVTRALFRRPWSVRVRERGPQPTRGWPAEQELVRWRAGNLYADPFLFEHQGRHHLFCEEVPLGASRAVISHTELHLDGSPAEPPECVLAQPYHLSYPFVFAHGEELFMIPETSAAGRVELYRAEDFPHSWQRAAILMENVDAADATVMADGDRLWMFAGVAAPDASSLDELHLFWADAPRGPWHPHPRNPVVSDARRARPAGAIQRWGSRLVRPGQDGSRRYGGAISFCEIDILNESEYAEHEVARLEPADVVGARATHTYTSDTRFEAIDLRRRELRLAVRAKRSGRS